MKRRRVERLSDEIARKQAERGPVVRRGFSERSVEEVRSLSKGGAATLERKRKSKSDG